jgi:hypothetical protein
MTVISHRIPASVCIDLLLISEGCPHRRRLQVAPAVTMKRGGAQTTPDDVSPTSSLSLSGLPDVLQRHIASFCTPKTRTYTSRLAK